jgi:glucose-6-phosphate 1-dehydrogenase
MDATIWCTCPVCYGKRWADMPEYLREHRQVEVREHEVTIEVAEPASQYVWTFNGVEDEDGELNVLVNVYPDDGIAEVSYRRHHWETWSAPTECVIEDVHRSRSMSNHPSNVSRIQ